MIDKKKGEISLVNWLNLSLSSLPSFHGVWKHLASPKALDCAHQLLSLIRHTAPTKEVRRKGNMRDISWVPCTFFPVLCSSLCPLPFLCAAPKAASSKSSSRLGRPETIFYWGLNPLLTVLNMPSTLQ